MKRVLVTGASGFAGQHVCTALRDRDDFVVHVVRDRINNDVFRVTVYGDLSDIAFLERAIAEYEIDVVVHLAAQAQVSVAATDPIGTLESNIRGTWNVLEACRRQGVNRIVVASSDKVYSDGKVPYTEDQPILAHDIYGTSKTAADLIAQTYIRQYNLSIAIARCGNIYGPGNYNRSTLIGGTILTVLDEKCPVIRSDGTPRRDYLYIHDAVSAYLALIDSDYIGPMNFGTSQPTTVFNVVRRILDVMGKSDIEPEISNTASGEIYEQWLDSSLANRVLGWKSKFDLEHGLNETISWYLDHTINTRQ